MRWFTGLFASLLLLGATHSVQAARGDDLVHTTLLVDTSAIKAGSTFHLGILLKIDPTWHVYWKNPGDSGLPTRFSLKLPTGFVAGDVQFPLPTRLQLAGNVTNFAYENEVMFIVPVTAPANLSLNQTVPLSVQVRWLVCNEVCLPGTSTVSIDLPVQDSMQPANIDLFKQWTAQLPQEKDDGLIKSFSQSTSVSATGVHPTRNSKISVGWKNTPTKIDWIPALDNNTTIDDFKITTVADVTTITYRASGTGDVDTTVFDSLLIYTRPDGTRAGLQLSGSK